MDRIQNQKDKLLDDTGAWILGHPTFTTWLNVTSSRTIWIHGDPGKGKTMLAISLVQELSSRISFEGSASTTAIACFFCDNKDSRRNTGTAILRGLIYQLICQRPELCVFLRDQYEKQKDQLFNSTNSLQFLWRIFQTITKKTGLAQVFVVIDALDECEPESLESFITLLDPDIETSSDDNAEKSTMVGGSRMKWLLTSRNELVIKQGLFGSLEISLEANHLQVEDSVRKFIGVKIEQLRRRKGYDHQLSKFVEETLREKAEGTFLWVALACKELSKPSVLSVNTGNVLLRLPSGIMPLYGRILENILGFEDKEIANYAKAILRSMVIAFRPLTLNELAIAASLPEEHHHDLSLLKEYVNVCGSLVTIRENIAYFVHLSAKTYILSNGLGSVLSPDLRADHQLLALNCFEHVSKKLSRDHTRTESLPGSELHQLGPEYPTLFWIQHARQSPSGIAESFDLDAEFFQSNSAQRQAWLDEYWTKSHAKWESKPGSFTALHLVSYAGLTPLLQNLLVKLHLSDIAAQDSLGNTPLLWAAKSGFEACVILLVKMGASVATENREGMTALLWAAGNGHEAIVKYLFEHNASIETKDRNGWAPLHRAAYNGHTNVVKLLVKLGADVETFDGCTWTAMHRAASMGQSDVVRFLMDVRASTGPLDREGMTPMLHAAWAGQHEVMRLFFDCGMDVDSQDYNGWTALHNAAWNGHVPTVKFLLDREASVQVKNSDGSTPLHHAVWSGQADVVQLLVKAGADVDAKAFDEDETPLQQAAWHGHHSCVELLLKAKAEVDMQNAVGHTALHQAASNGHESVVRLLLEYEADPQIIDKHGQTARALAEANEHETTAFILKERMAALEAFSEGTRTPVDLPCLDEAVAAALGVDPMISTVQPHQAPGFFVPEKITTVKDGKQKFYYMKSGGNKEMFESRSLIGFLFISIVTKFA
jgi:ankyrin repeat protein